MEITPLLLLKQLSALKLCRFEGVVNLVDDTNFIS
jgi:hypothetical protein